MAYWQARSLRAEQALTQARAGLYGTCARTALLSVLGDLRPDESLTTMEMAQKLSLSRKSAYKACERAAAWGLIERVDDDRSAQASKTRYRGETRWRLGYLVVAPELAQAEEGTE